MIRILTAIHVSALYALIVKHCDHFVDVVQRCMKEAIIDRGSFQDPHSTTSDSMPLPSQAIIALAKVLFELVIQ